MKYIVFDCWTRLQVFKEIKSNLCEESSCFAWSQLGLMHALYTLRDYTYLQLINQLWVHHTVGHGCIPKLNDFFKFCIGPLYYPFHQKIQMNTPQIKSFYIKQVLWKGFPLARSRIYIRSPQVRACNVPMHPTCNTTNVHSKYSPIAPLFVLPHCLNRIFILTFYSSPFLASAFTRAWVLL